MPLTSIILRSRVFNVVLSVSVVLRVLSGGNGRSSIMSTAALVVSTAFIAGCAAAACAARRSIGRLVKPGLVQELFYEAVAAAELCACCFELIISELECLGGIEDVHVFFYFIVFGMQHPL